MIVRISKKGNNKVKSLENKQNGFGTIEALLVIIIIVLIGVISILVNHQKHLPNPTKSVASTAQTTTNTPTSTQSTSGQYMTITQWGVKLPLSSGIKGITYSVSTANNVQSANVNVPNSLCQPMATIYRGGASSIDPTTEGFDSNGTTFQANNDRQIGAYYYSFMTGNASSCFKGEQMIAGTGDGVQTEAVYSQLKTAFNHMTLAN